MQVDSDEEVEAIAEETYSGGARRWSPINWTPEEWDQDERPRLSQNELPPLQIEVVEDERTQVGRGTSHFVEDVDLESDGSVIDDDSQPFALSDDDIAHFGPAQIALESNGSVIDDNVAHSSPLQIDFDDDESDPEVEKPSHFDPPQSHLEIDLDDESDLDVTEPSKPIERFRIFSPIDTSDASSEVEVESPKPVLLPLLSRSQAHSRALLSLGGIFDSPYPDKDSDDDQSDHSSQSSLPASKEPPPSSQASPARHSNAHTFADESLQTFSMRIQELKEMQKDGDEESCASHLPSPKESPPRAVERRLFVEEASEEERQQGRDDLMAILDAVADARRRGTLVESDEESEVDEDDFVDEADDVDEDDFGDLVELDDGDFDRACAGILVVKAENELDENESKQDESDVEEPSEQVCEGWKTWRMNVASESMEDVDAEMGWVPAVTFGEEPLEVERVEQAVEDSSTVVESAYLSLPFCLANEPDPPHRRACLHPSLLPPPLPPQAPLLRKRPRPPHPHRQPRARDRSPPKAASPLRPLPRRPRQRSWVRRRRRRGHRGVVGARGVRRGDGELRVSVAACFACFSPPLLPSPFSHFLVSLSSPLPPHTPRFVLYRSSTVLALPLPPSRVL